MRFFKALLLTLSLFLPVLQASAATPPDTLKLTAGDTALADTLAGAANAHQFEERPSTAKFGVAVIWLVGGAAIMGYLVTRNMHMKFFEK